MNRAPRTLSKPIHTTGGVIVCVRCLDASTSPASLLEILTATAGRQEVPARELPYWIGQEWPLFLNNLAVTPDVVTLIHGTAYCSAHLHTASREPLISGQPT